MTSNISFQGINEFFPVAGQDNDTQGFRDNFDTIKQGLRIANEEVSDLQANTARTDQDTDYNLFKIKNAVLENVRAQKLVGFEGTNVNVSPTSIDFSLGSYHLYKVGSGTVLDPFIFDFVNFPGDPALVGGSEIGVGSVILELYSDGQDRTVAFRPSGNTVVKKNNFPVMPEGALGDIIVRSAVNPVFIEVWRHTANVIYIKYLGYSDPNNTESFASGGGGSGLQGTQGAQGTQGFGRFGPQGIQGVQGPQGIQGVQGPQGTQGLPGAFAGQGIQGVQGIQGPQSPQGTQGLQGPLGFQGIQGLPGSFAGQGIQGVQGPQGTQGTQGIQGNDGAAVFQGIQGTQGAQGLVGSQGGQGIQGVTGAQGTQGIQGIQGNSGAFVAQGIQGVQGPQGIQGTQGTQGPQGTQGIQGLQGNDGAFVSQGIQGIQGQQGIQGIQGQQGIQGVQGSTGAQGIQGIQGIQGPQPAITGRTPVTLSTQTSVLFSGLSTILRRVTVLFDQVSTSTGDDILIQIGGSGGLESSNYNSISTTLQASPVSTTSSSGFQIYINNSSDSISGELTLYCLNKTNDTWTAAGNFLDSTANITQIISGRKILVAGPLERVNITTVNGTSTFDVGTINLLVE